MIASNSPTVTNAINMSLLDASNLSKTTSPALITRREIRLANPSAPESLSGFSDGDFVIMRGKLYRLFLICQILSVTSKGKSVLPLFLNFTCPLP